VPFTSKAQQAYLFIHHPKIAREFASKTTNYKNLPDHVKQKAIKEAAKRSK